MRIRIFRQFLHNEKSGGLVLILCTLISLTIANLSFGSSYQEFWHLKLFGLSIEHWINDGLMAIFFLFIGLELEREIYDGALSRLKDAMLPIFAAVGGIVLPAAIYMIFNFGTPTQSGAGIPMATDIAFALGILSLLGSRVPISLKIFLTALAVIDDLCAIIIIAVFYTNTLVITNLFIALSVFALLLLFNKLKVNNIFIYIIGGIIMWYFMLNSGVHATITGVLLAFAIPYRKGLKSLSHKVEHFLHIPVAFIVLPIFALANTAIEISGQLSQTLLEDYSIGILLGLVIGKPVGILLFTLLGILLGFCKLPKAFTIKNIIGVGFLAGIGFTMSIFITLLAFTDITIINNSKLVILISSLIAGSIGFIILKFTLPKIIKDKI